MNCRWKVGRRNENPIIITEGGRIAPQCAWKQNFTTDSAARTTAVGKKLELQSILLHVIASPTVNLIILQLRVIYYKAAAIKHYYVDPCRDVETKIDLPNPCDGSW